MTDEEMAEEYREKHICNTCADIQDCGNDCPFSRCGVQAFLAGLKVGRPQWHNVVDGDLPKKVGDYVTNIGVLTYDSYGNGVYKWHTPFCEACDYSDVVGDDEVITWCEIPTFDKE